MAIYNKSVEPASKKAKKWSPMWGIINGFLIAVMVTIVNIQESKVTYLLMSNVE